MVYFFFVLFVFAVLVISWQMQVFSLVLAVLVGSWQMQVFLCRLVLAVSDGRVLYDPVGPPGHGQTFVR
jgi:hypothetical protein